MDEFESGPAGTASCQGLPLPLELDGAELVAAHESGDARSLSALITDIAKYHGAWWIAHGDVWLRITDEATIVKLERHNEWASPRLLRDA